MFPAAKYRREGGRLQEPPAHHDRLENRAKDGLRAGRKRVHRRRGGAVVARRLEAGAFRAGSGRTRGHGEGQWRTFPGAAFAGLGAPHWDPYARGILIGITRDATGGHVARAALEGVAFQVADLLEAMQSDTGKKLRELRVDGGLTRSELLMQFQADILGIPIVRPAVTENNGPGSCLPGGTCDGILEESRG